MSDIYLVKRPSRKDDDEALEEMQKEFLQGEFKSSAEVKYSGSPSHTTNVPHSPSQIASSSETVSDTIVPVLFDVVERDVINFPVSEPKPAVRSAPSSRFATWTKDNKKSIFLQEMEALEKDTKKIAPSTSSVVENELAVGSCIIDGSGLKSQATNAETKIIHEENLHRMAQMSYNEIMKERAQLEKQLGPDLVQFIRSRRKNKNITDKGESHVKAKSNSPQGVSQKLPQFNFSKSSFSVEKLSGDINETVLKMSEGCDQDALLLEQCQDLNIGPVDKANEEDTEKETGSSRDVIKESIEVPMTELPIDPQEAGNKWLHMNTVEKDKLAWMTLLPKPKPIDLKSGYAARFDFEGKLLSRSEDISTQRGLHHHSNEPEVPGYGIEELFMLSRSSFQSHRITALQTLAHVLENYWDGRFDGCFDVPLLDTLLGSGIAPLLRYALDDSAVPSVAAAVLAVHHLLICKADEACLDWTFCWQNGYMLPFLNAEDSEPNVNLEELTDTNIIKLDVIKGFLRMDILPRFRYILQTMNPASSVCQLIIEICTRMARHSEESAKTIAEFPSLLDEIFQKFLPLDWNCHDSRKGVDYYPLYSAMKLIRIIASASYELAVLVVKKYHLADSLKCYLAIDPSDGKLPAADIQKLMIESLKTWKVFLSYDLCTEIYSEMFPLLIKYFQFCQSLSLNTNVDKNIQNYEYAMYLMKTLQSVVEGIKPLDTSRSIDVCQSSIISWKDVSTFFKMCDSCLNRWLFQFSTGETNYAGRVLLASCFDLFTSFCLTADKNSSFKEDVLKSSEEIMNHLIPFLRSTEFSKTLSHLNPCSLLLHSGHSGKVRDVKVLTSLGSVCWKDDVIPLLKEETPIPLLSSITRLIVAVNQLQDISINPMVSQLLINQWLVIDYLENVVSSSRFFSHWFDRFEVDCISHLLELFCVTGNEKTELWYKVALSLLTCFKTPFEPCAEKVMTKAIFNSNFFRKENEEILSMGVLEDIKKFYCSYFFQSEEAKSSRLSKQETLSFEGSIPSLLNKKWCYDPILKYYDQSRQSGFKPLSPMERHGVKCCLQWVHSSSKLEYSAISVIPVSVRFCSLCMVFLMDSDLFANNEIQELLLSCLNDIVLSQSKASLTKMKWENITDFGEIYAELLVQFESVSYGDHLFGAFVMFPLQQIYPSKWKLLLLTEHPHVVQFLSVPLSKLIVPIRNYLEPLEKDENVLKCYYKLLSSGVISQLRSPTLFLIAIHHLHHFIKLEDELSLNSKSIMTLQNSIKNMKNKDIANRILQYSDQNYL